MVQDDLDFILQDTLDMLAQNTSDPLASFDTACISGKSCTDFGCLPMSHGACIVVHLTNLSMFLDEERHAA